MKKRLIRFRFVLGVLTLLSLQACPLLVIAALPADMTQARAAEGLRVALTITDVAAKTGDHATITKPRQNFLSAGGELTRPYLVHINSTSPQGRTAVGESPRCIRVKVFKSKWLH